MVQSCKQSLKETCRHKRNTWETCISFFKMHHGVGLNAIILNAAVEVTCFVIQAAKSIDLHHGTVDGQRHHLNSTRAELAFPV